MGVNERRRGSRLATQRMAVILCVVFAPGCAIDPATGHTQIREMFASENPCSNNARNIGIAVGAVAGAIIGNQLKHSDASRLGGAAVGALFGGLVGADMDSRRCELAKIAKQYDLDIQMAFIKANGEVGESDGVAGAKEDAAGLAVVVREKDGGGHFEVGSDRLAPRAAQYFAAIAHAYSPQANAAGIQGAKERAEYLQTAKQKKILLVGHTDDVGSSEYNAELSERRARAVANFLTRNGVPEELLYFQGAGESLPVADNRTELGRVQNRRVEIVEVNGEPGFKKYLKARHPNHEYYRPVDGSAGLIARTTRMPSVASGADVNRNAMEAAKTIAPPAKAQGSGGAHGAKASGSKVATAVNNGGAAGGIQRGNMVHVVAPPKGFDLGGQLVNGDNSFVDAGRVAADEGGFSLISKAYADDAVVFNGCDRDRHRVAGAVKSLRDGKVYSTGEYMTGLYNTSWHETLNGNLIMLNRVAILRDAAAPSAAPELKVYADYDPQKNRNAKPDVALSPAVNVYRGSKGVLYRLFANGERGIQCMDVLFPAQGGTAAKTGKIIYSRLGETYVAEFKPKMLQMRQ